MYKKTKRTRFPEETVLKIYKDLEAGERIVDVAAKYGVNTGVITRLRLGRSYTDLHKKFKGVPRDASLKKDQAAIDALNVSIDKYREKHKDIIEPWYNLLEELKLAMNRFRTLKMYHDKIAASGKKK